jgi:ADP-heptose:LPS heptosyltransferase
LRGRGFDLAIDVRGEFPLAMVLWLSGARRRIGWDCGGGGFLLTDSADFQRGRPEVLSRHALLTAIGLELAPGDVHGPHWCVQPETRRAIEQQMTNWRVAGRPLCVLHVGAGTQAKRWSSAHWRELLGRILVELNGQVILVGGPADRNIAAQITEQRIWPDVYDWSGCLTLGELAALAQMADLFVGADSGPAHVAAASGANVLVLFSGTNHLQQWRPWGRHVSVMHEPVACSPCHREACPWSDHPCMQQITPANVLAQMAQRLAATEPSKVELLLQTTGAGQTALSEVVRSTA